MRSIEHLQHADLEAELREKKQRWERIEQEVDRLVDGLGLNIDERIKPVVVGLKAHGFGTTGSCEGHLDHGHPYPWVHVESPLADRLQGDRRYNDLLTKYRAFQRGTTSMSRKERKEYGRLVEAQIRENQEAYERLLQILNEFYEIQLPQDDSRRPPLTVDKFGWNTSTLMPDGIPTDDSGEDLSNLWPDDLKRTQLPLFQAEMQRFADFLREQYLGVARPHAQRLHHRGPSTG